uniref:HSF-type DNA-binding domain-containing protein n=1 Tax=Anopheles farauti TaxID=69004 RepID=A0A182QUQ3_9DIPT
MESVDSIEHTEMMEVCVMKAEVSKLRFELKLWLVTNSDSMNYLRWNHDRTVLVVNVLSLANCLRTKGDSIFLCRTVSDFLWLLHYNGFQACPLERLEASRLDDIELDCLFFEHPQFIGSNMDIFNAWISDEHRSVHENNAGMCTVPRSSGFRRRSELSEFVNIMSKVTLRMNYVKTIMREKLLQQGSVTIPEIYEDRAVIDAPSYVANKEIAGYYGAVNAGDVREFLGSLVPMYYDGPEASEEVPHQEDDDGDIGISSNEPEWVEIITIDYSDSTEDEIIEIHETYEILNESKEENIKIEDQHEDEEFDNTFGTKNMSDFLTQSIQSCITALDSD